MKKGNIKVLFKTSIDQALPKASVSVCRANSRLCSPGDRGTEKFTCAAKFVTVFLLSSFFTVSFLLSGNYLDGSHYNSRSTRGSRYFTGLSWQYSLLSAGVLALVCMRLQGCTRACVRMRMRAPLPPHTREDISLALINGILTGSHENGDLEVLRL